MPLTKSCLVCPFREKGPLCGHKDEVAQKFSDSLVRYAVSEKHKAVLHEGEPVHGLFFLCKGAVKLTKWLPNGQEIIVDVMTPCSILSSTALLGGSGIHKLSAVTVQGDAEVAFLQVKSLAALAAKLPEIQISLLHAVSESLDQTRDRLAMCRLPVSERLMAMLVRLSNQFSTGPGARFRLPLSFSELAQLAHTTLETVSRTLRKFQRQGLISMSRGGMVTLLRLTIPDKTATNRGNRS